MISQKKVKKIEFIVEFIILDTCHALRGTDGVFFPPIMDKKYPVWIYVPEMCRSVFADYESEVEVKDVTAWRYRANLNLINYTHPENLCFCRAFRWCAKSDENGERWNLSQCENPCLDGTLHVSGRYLICSTTLII